MMLIAATLRLCLLTFALLPASLAPQAPVERQQPAPLPSSPAAQGDAPDARPAYTREIFKKALDLSQVSFLGRYAGRTTADLLHDKAAMKTLWSFVPRCEFHYGRDMPLQDALQMVTDHANDPVLLVEKRYLVVSGENGPYLSGKAALWIDLQEGTGLGVFYFTPTNGEPTPSLVVFSSQIEESSLRMSQMPPVFVEFLTQWTARRLIAPITPRYFIGSNHKRLLLEHNEDFCAAYGNLASAHPACDQANADAADVDVSAAYYLDKIRYATNGTAWMLGPDQAAWISFRNQSCASVSNPLPCRTRMSRERTHAILHLPPPRPRR